MSYGIVSEVSREHPELLTANLGRTCFQHTAAVVAKLRGRGFDAYLMCKSPGEGQYTPPGFTPRDVIGLDGKTYRCSGFSHDAIWCDQAQYDTLNSANEHDRPIYRRQGEPNWSFDPADGPQIVATPAWNPVKPSDWRHNNPPFMESVPTPEPSPVPQPVPVTFPYPDEHTAVLDFEQRVEKAYKAVNRKFPDPHDADAFRHFVRYGYSCHEMPEPEAANKHIKELREELGAPPE